MKVKFLFENSQLGNYKKNATTMFVFPSVTKEVVSPERLALARALQDDMLCFLEKFFGHQERSVNFFDLRTLESVITARSFLAGHCVLKCARAHCGYEAYVPISFVKNAEIEDDAVKIDDKIEYAKSFLLKRGGAWCGHEVKDATICRNFEVVRTSLSELVEKSNVNWRDVHSLALWGEEAVLRAPPGSSPDDSSSWFVACRDNRITSCTHNELMNYLYRALENFKNKDKLGTYIQIATHVDETGIVRRKEKEDMVRFDADREVCLLKHSRARRDN